MKNVMIVPVGVDGKDIEDVYVGLRSFETSKIILITREENLEEAKKVEGELEKFKLPVITEVIRGPVMEEMLRIFSKIKKTNKQEENIIVNIATGDKFISCAALSSAFVNGFMAFAVMNNEPALFPVLKFTYYKLLKKQKMKILELLDEKNCSSLEELSKKIKLSLPLVSYHIQGNRESRGLVDLGLVHVSKKSGKIKITLSQLGKLLVKGYVD